MSHSGACDSDLSRLIDSRLAFARHSPVGGVFNSRRLVIQFMLCSDSSFRRKPESSVFVIARHSSESWNPAFAVAFYSSLTASVRFSARIRASGSLSLACARESNQREHTPGAAPPAAVREVRPGFARWASCPFANSRASLRATLSGDSGLPSPRLTGPRIKSDSKSKAALLCFSLLASARRTRALCSSRGPMALRRQRAIRPAGCARGIARIPLLHTDVQSAEPDR